MFPALHKKFLIITPSLASAFPDATSTITTSAHSATTSSSSPPSLPLSLQALVPECAQSCVELILFDEWPLACSTSGDLECLCSRYSTTGLTLGEAAYACAVTACPSSTPDLASTYSICSGQDGAVVATHSTLTFTAHITSTADPTASPASSASIRTNTTSARNSSTSSASRTSSPTTLDSSTTPVSSASSAPAPTSTRSSASSSAASAAAASSSSGGNGLSTAQIIGISVASVSAVVLAVGVLFLMACLRKRDRKKQEGMSEKQGRSAFALTPPSHDNIVMSPTALEQFPSPPRNRKDPRNGAGVGTGITIPQVRVDAASPPRQRAPTPLENIGLAITEDSPIASPASFSSNRTVSQLLPDKPEPVIPRQPAPVSKSPVPTSAPFIAKRKKPQRDSSMTQDTVFEEDTAVRRSMYPAKAVSVPPRKQPPPIVPPVRPYRPPPSFAQDYTASPETTRQPSLSLTIPPQGRQYPRQPTPSPPPIPSPLRIARPPNVAKPPIPLYYQRPAATVLPGAADPHSSGSSGSTRFTGTNSTASSSYIPAYYTSPPTSIMQTPPESYRGYGTNATFSNGGPVPQTQSSSSPQRQAQTRSPPHATTSTTQNRLPPQPQPAFAHPGVSTTGQQQRMQQQGAQANPPALRQWYPPPAPGAAAPANGQQQPAFARLPPHHQDPSSGSTSLAQSPAVANGPLPVNQGSQYIPYSSSTAYARPPLPPRPQSPHRSPRGNARGNGQQTTRTPLAERSRIQRSTSCTSMTSFESANPDDPSPPEDEETAAKQLGPDHHHPHQQISADAGSHYRHNYLGGRLTPNANEGDDDDAAADRSPISDIRYPKVPRASNQAVPRSSPNAGPRTATPSPRVKQQQDGSPSAANSPPGLLARRRGEGNGLLIDSGSVTPTKNNVRSPRTPEGKIIGGERDVEEKDQARKSSAALPPAEREKMGDSSIATPTWVPRLTPTRRGDDLYLAVAYASKEGIP